MFQIQRLRVECFNLNSAVSESVRFEVVVSDLGSADLAQPEQRAKRALLPNATTVDACTPEYRAPDLFLGNSRFGTEVDLWSAGGTHIPPRIRHTPANIRTVFWRD